MSNLSDARKALKDAQAELDSLQADLPRFQELAQTNEADVQRMRKEKADVAALGQAKTAAIAARELLEQHESDLEAARTDVERLTVEVDRLEGIEELKHIAKRAQKARAAFGQALIDAYQAARDAFQEAGAKRQEWLKIIHEVPGAISSMGVPIRATDDKFDPEAHADFQAFQAFAQELEAEGVDVDSLFAVPDDITSRSVPYAGRARAVNVRVPGVSHPHQVTASRMTGQPLREDMPVEWLLELAAGLPYLATPQRRG